MRALFGVCGLIVFAGCNSAEVETTVGNDSSATKTTDVSEPADKSTVNDEESYGEALANDKYWSLFKQRIESYRLKDEKGEKNE